MNLVPKFLNAVEYKPAEAILVGSKESQIDKRQECSVPGKDEAVQQNNGDAGYNLDSSS